MTEQEKIEALEKLLPRKRSRQYYSEQLDMDLDEVERLIRKIRTNSDDADLTIEGSNSFQYNLDKGTYEVEVYYNQPPTPEIVIRDHKVDVSKWKLSSFYSKQKSKGWQITALFKNITPEQEQVESFQEFLKTWKTDYKPVKRDAKNLQLGPGALLLNKQDAHLNKKSLNGDNDIFERFEQYEGLIDKTLLRAGRLSNIEHITYIIGSDHFNSEITGATVKGTPQVNILDYQLSFELVCRHEVNVINRLLEGSDNVDIIYLLGNHDLCVSYHMASWLKVYYKNESRVNVDINSDFTKYFSIFDTAIGINHGDVQKPERLVQNFPLEYKEGFGKANHHVFLIGDKHTELTKDIGGVKFFQIPALSKARGAWEKQMGYTTTPAQMTSFLIEPGNGVSTIFKETL